LEILALESFEDRSMAVMIPPGSIVIVVNHSCPNDDRLAEISWDNQKLMVFSLDLTHRATRAGSATAT
jgi:hypothetical protein